MDSSTDSFVVVHHPHSTAPLHRFLPALAHPHHWHQLEPLVDQLTEQRTNQPGSQYYIHHLLSIALPTNTPEYPPTSHADLTHLVSALLTSPANPLTAKSCLYYLALAFSPDDPSRAAALARDQLLPAAFRLSVRAFHALDTCNYAEGVKLLADPRVSPDFVPRTFALLATCPPPSERSKLVLSYWRLAGINLDDQSKDEVKVVLRALCGEGRKSGANEAWALAREWKNEEEREELARTVLETCFGKNASGLPLAQHLASLLARPLTPTGDVLTTAFCASPPSPLSPNLTADWRLSKLVAESRPVDALRFWAQVKSKKGVEPSEQRDRLLAALESSLTPVQRTTLSLEIAPAAAAATAVSTKPSAAPAASGSTITQPAWAPVPAPAAPAQPAQPPRTLAAARAAQLPPPAAPAPAAADLPLSASPFLRGPAAQHGTGAAPVLQALEVAQTPARKASSAAPATHPALAPASAPPAAPGSPFSFRAISVAQSAASAAASSAASTAGGAPSPARPTVSGFGSVRPNPPAPAAPLATPRAARGASRRFEVEPEADEDEDGDEAMADAAAPIRAEDAQEEEDDGFAARAALDPAIAATIAAAESPRAAPPPPQSAAKRSRVSNGAAARDRTRSRGDKRRAVSAEPEEAPAQSTSTSQTRARGGRAAREKPDASRTVRLPPGAFPGEEDEAEPAQAEEQEEEQEEEQAPRRTSKPRRASQSQSTAQRPKTPARRSTRASTVELDAESEAGADDDDTRGASGGRGKTTRTRRATRTSNASVTAEAKTPARRSSRLSGAAATPAAEEGEGRTQRRATRASRRGGRIEEEHE
ncbi:hypothetical protein JCM10207_004912 [Rhodosporidiobolus poonsookiae]